MKTSVVKVTKTYEWIRNTLANEKHLIGGAGSGKSHAIAQYLLIDKFSNGFNRILVLRKTLPSLKISAYQVINDLAKEYQLPHKLNKTDMILSNGKSRMLFKSLDDPEKIKSAEFDVIFIEEATDLTLEDYRQLKLRIGRTSNNAELILAYNPISQHHWLKTEVIDKGKIAINKTTYKDNPFLSKEFIDQIEDLIHQDKNYWRIYGLGEWGVLTNTIYSNWDTDWKECEGEIIYGLDFGYTNPSTLIEIKIDEQDLYLKELIYEPKLLNDQLITKMSISKMKEIYADPANPDKIREIYNAGFNIHEASKSVKDGIDMVKRYKLHIHPESANIIKEISGYSWKTDKNSQVLEEPIKFNDHAMDAIRYAVYTYFKGDNQLVDFKWRE